MSLATLVTRLKVRVKTPMPNKLLFRDSVTLNVDGTQQTLPLTRIADDTYESQEAQVTRYAKTVKALSQGLVAEYLFFEGSGTTLHDTSGNGLHGTFNATPPWKTLANGKHYVEGGGGHYAEAPHSDMMETGTLVIEMVCRPIKVTGGWTTAVYKGASYRAHGWQIEIKDWGTRLEFGLILHFSGGYNWAIHRGPLPDYYGTWHHLVFVYSEQYNVLEVYHNGVKATTDKRYTKPYVKTTANLRVSFFADPYRVDIALLRIWNEKLLDHLNATGKSIDDFAAELYQLAKLVVPELP